MDDHASNGAVEAMGHSHEALTTTSKIVLEKVLGVSIMPTNLSDLAVAGETFRVTSEIDLLCERVAEHLSKKRLCQIFRVLFSILEMQFWQKSLVLERANWALCETLVFGWADRQGQTNILMARELE